MWIDQLTKEKLATNKNYKIHILAMAINAIPCPGAQDKEAWYGPHQHQKPNMQWVRDGFNHFLMRRAQKGNIYGKKSPIAIIRYVLHIKL